MEYIYKLRVNGSEIAELACEIDCDVYLENGEPQWTIHTVWVFGMDADKKETCTDLTQSDDPFLKKLGLDILDAVENDDDLFAAFLDDAGFYYVGSGNDPDGHWTQGW